MKLSKQERIGVLIIAVILIIGLGIWLYIVPKVQKVGESNVTLASKTQELQTAKDKAAQKDPLYDQVIDAYEAGQNLADMFFEEMTAYQVDAEFRAFLDQCKSNVYVADYSVGAPTVTTLSPKYFEETEVVYALKTYVTQDIEPTEEELATQARWEAIQQALGASQDVGSISITFDVTALSPEEIMAFCDEVNEYVKSENGKSTRKAVMLSGMGLSYPEHEEMYKELEASIEEEAAEKALDEIYKANNAKRPVVETQQKPEAEEEVQYNPSDTIYTLSTTITFFSVERMQDPTPQLDAQEQ